mgnify:CR=1 FL=1
MVCNNIGVNDLGHLTFNGFDTVELAQQYPVGSKEFRIIANASKVLCEDFIDTQLMRAGLSREELRDALELIWEETK